VYINQVPFNINPLDPGYFKKTGLFFVEMKDFVSCFHDFAQAINLNDKGYSNDWYDVDNEETMWGSKLGPASNFSFIVPKLNDTDVKDNLYISIEGYINKMIPLNCYKN